MQSDAGPLRGSRIYERRPRQSRAACKDVGYAAVPAGVHRHRDRSCATSSPSAHRSVHDPRADPRKFARQSIGPGKSMLPLEVICLPTPPSYGPCSLCRRRRQGVAGADLAHTVAAGHRGYDPVRVLLDPTDHSLIRRFWPAPQSVPQRGVAAGRGGSTMYSGTGPHCGTACGPHGVPSCQNAASSSSMMLSSMSEITDHSALRCGSTVLAKNDATAILPS